MQASLPLKNSSVFCSSSSLYDNDLIKSSYFLYLLQKNRITLSSKNALSDCIQCAFFSVSLTTCKYRYTRTIKSCIRGFDIHLLRDSGVIPFILEMIVIISFVAVNVMLYGVLIELSKQLLWAAAFLNIFMGMRKLV